MSQLGGAGSAFFAVIRERLCVNFRMHFAVANRHRSARNRFTTAAKPGANAARAINPPVVGWFIPTCPDACSIIGCKSSLRQEVVMGFPNCKLMDMTGPMGFPESVALGEVQGGERFEVSRIPLRPNNEIQRTLFEFDDQTFVPFQNELQLRLGLNAVGGGQDLGETIISAADVNRGELTTRFHPAGIGGPFYELTYKVLPG
jgi:hypothetical protein